jgi:hypothetical protein
VPRVEQVFVCAGGGMLANGLTNSSSYRYGFWPIDDDIVLQQLRDRKHCFFGAVEGPFDFEVDGSRR